MIAWKIVGLFVGALVLLAVAIPAFGATGLTSEGADTLSSVCFSSNAVWSLEASHGISTLSEEKSEESSEKKERQQAPPSKPAEVKPVEPFEPSEKIRADQAVDFPYDI